jgi:taurine dioxygenase
MFWGGLRIMLKRKEYHQFIVEPCTPAIGGRIKGCHLSELDETGAADLRDALWEYGVLFATKQHLSFEQMKQTAHIFGERLEEHTFAPTMAEEGHPEVVKIERLKGSSAKTTTDIWHHDVVSRTHPNIMSILQADQVPFGADTMWASMTAAYDRLPYAMKLLFANLMIEHDSLYLALRHDFGGSGITPESMAALAESAVHPAVVSHHATNRPCLFVGNGHVKRVSGYPTDFSEYIIKMANELPKIPELQVRHKWEAGDVAMWDNFGTAHYGVTADLADQDRLLHRVAAWSEKVVPYQDRETVMQSLASDLSSFEQAAE